jgi:hypothetical protein
MSPAVAKTETAARAARTDQAFAAAMRKAAAKDKGDDAFGLVRLEIPYLGFNPPLPLGNFALFS